MTHDPLEAMVLADRLVVIEGGRVVQDGTPAEVARRPATQYVARLMGLNLYAGLLGPGGVGRARRRRAARVAATPGRRTGPGAGRACARRASRCTPRARSRPARGNVWPGTVTGLELLADRVRVQVEGQPSALVDVTPAAVAELAVRPGQPVWLSAKATEAEAYPDADA